MFFKYCCFCCYCFIFICLSTHLIHVDMLIIIRHKHAWLLCEWVCCTLMCILNEFKLFQTDLHALTYKDWAALLHWTGTWNLLFLISISLSPPSLHICHHLRRVRTPGKAGLCLMRVTHINSTLIELWMEIFVDDRRAASRSQWQPCGANGSIVGRPTTSAL